MEDLFEDRPKVNVLEKISLWWRFDGRYYHKFLKHGMKNLIYWFPIIWKDRNYDHDYILTILKHKIKAQSKHIGEKGNHVNAPMDAKRMMICVNLIQKLQDSFYEMEYMNYAKDRHWFTPCEDIPGSSLWNSENIWEKYDEYFAKYPLIYKKVMAGEGVFPLEGREDDKHVIAMNISHFNQNRAHKLLFKIMEENINSWWD